MVRVERLLQVLEELLRDTIVVSAGGTVQPIHADRPEVLTAWSSALWPSGIDRCRLAIAEARADLALNVTGKTALDALMTTAPPDPRKKRAAVETEGSAA